MKLLACSVCPADVRHLVDHSAALVTEQTASAQFTVIANGATAITTPQSTHQCSNIWSQTNPRLRKCKVIQQVKWQSLLPQEHLEHWERGADAGRGKRSLWQQATSLWVSK